MNLAAEAFANKLNLKNEEQTPKSIFKVKDFHLTKENFKKWFRPLKHHLIALDYYTYIENEIEYEDMTEGQRKIDSSVQSIIESSLDN